MDKNNPHALLVEFRSTGTPVGEVMIKAPADSSLAEVSCHFYKGVYKGFQKSRFEAEIPLPFDLVSFERTSYNRT